MELTASELAKRINAELAGDGGGVIKAVGPIGSAIGSDVTFVSSNRHAAELKESKAGAAIVSERVDGFCGYQLLVKNVDAALIETLKIFAPELKGIAGGIDASAKIAEDVKIAEGVTIGAYAVIADGVRIGADSVIGHGCTIGENSRLGSNSRLDSGVVVEHNCIIGNHVIIQANSTIGATGFGYLFIDEAHRLIPHNGGVVIEDFVEIGANSCVDRGKFGNTVIGAGTKIDNLVQIAHNVVIGKCCLLAALVGISGSTKVGDGVIFAGASGASDNLTIGDGVILAAQTVATRNVDAGKQMFGCPAADLKEELKTIALRRRLPKFVEQLKQLSKRLEKLEAAKDNKG